MSKHYLLALCAFLGGVAAVVIGVSLRAKGADAPTPRAAVERIGYEVFFDRSVCSLRGTISCADCHNPDPRFGWSDGRKVAVGDFGNPNAPLGIMGVRNSRSLVSCYHLEHRLVWGDGRTQGLFAQCMTATQDPRVGAMPSVQAVVDRINARPHYRELALAAYASASISEGQLRECMVAFLKTIRSDDLPADRLAAGLPVNLPASAIRGWNIFAAHCIICHQPENDWRDYEFHNAGICARSRSSDLLRGAVTGRVEDNYKVATPTLREIAKTPPYMHDGSLPLLADVVAYFGAGGRYIVSGEMLRDPNIDEQIKSISLTKNEQSDLVDFLTLGFQNPPDKYPYRSNPNQ